MESPLNIPNLTLLVFQNFGGLYFHVIQQESHRRELLFPDHFLTPRECASGLTNVRQQEDVKEYFRKNSNRGTVKMPKAQKIL